MACFGAFSIVYDDGDLLKEEPVMQRSSAKIGVVVAALAKAQSEIETSTQRFLSCGHTTRRVSHAWLAVQKYLGCLIEHALALRNDFSRLGRG